MDGGSIYSRTSKGEEEVQTRKYGVSMAVRRVLILVDGKSTAERLFKSAHGVGDGPAALKELLQGGFIQEGAGRPAQTGMDSASPGRDSGPAEAIKQALIEAAHEVLGPDAVRIVEKIREAPTDREGLMASLQHCKKVVKLTISETKAKVLEQKCEEIIGRL